MPSMGYQRRAEELAQGNVEKGGQPFSQQKEEDQRDDDDGGDAGDPDDALDDDVRPSVLAICRRRGF